MNNRRFKRLFIVEDDVDISDLLEYNLKKEGYEVKTFNEGAIAFKKILDDVPDLIILDLTLPGMSGMEICRYVRHNKKTKNIPIIMLTARTAESDRLEGLKSGANIFISKPFSIKEVLANILELSIPEKVQTK